MTEKEGQEDHSALLAFLAAEGKWNQFLDAYREFLASFGGEYIDPKTGIWWGPVETVWDSNNRPTMIRAYRPRFGDYDTLHLGWPFDFKLDFDEFHRQWNRSEEERKGKQKSSK